MKKRFKHVFISAIILTLLFTLFVPLYASADEPGMSEQTATQTPETENNDVIDTAPEEVTDTEKDSFFDVLFSGITENLSQILSAMAFLGSLIIMLCYKKGFIPLVTDGLGAIASGVKAMNEKTGELGVGTKEFAQQIDERLRNAEELLENAQTIFDELESKLDELGAAKREREITNTVLLAEVDMLYEIFMSAALPQYLKDSVGEKMALMKAKLSCEGGDDEEN